jgi:hypothetical protein
MSILRNIWSILGIIETTNKDNGELFWKEWREILLTEFEGRLMAPGTKGYSVVSRKTFLAIFLQVKRFRVPAAGILPEAIKTIREKDTLQPDISLSDKEYDAIAMMGHRIGMLENSSGLKQYLQDIRRLLKSDGQILLTSLDVPTVNEPAHQANPVSGFLHLQQARLIGPFFGMLHVKEETLKSQAAAANWQCELMYRQDESNYCARLRLAESL